ncbi:MAG: ABC transporter ATP-binding protein [Thermoplasmata archaeon]|nr:ABC transporter ATP-binding protein [Thermoplasmata archaeon]
MSETVVEVRDLSKYYPPDVKAVDGISFTIGAGQIFSMLGPNGAGKTTTVEILEGLRNPTSGEVMIFGQNILKDYSKLRKRVGILPQNFEPFDLLKPWEAIQYWTQLYDIRITKKEINRALERVGLFERRNIHSKKLSGGEKRKLGIALSLVNNPELLFLDEPTTGLDPKGRRDLWALINEIKEKGTTVFLTTHYLDEAERLADDVSIMHKGKIIAEGSPDNLVEKYGKATIVVLEGAGSSGLQKLKEKGIDAHLDDADERDVLVPVRKHSEMKSMMCTLASSDINMADIYTRRETLEDVFLNLVGSKMEDGVLKE